MVWWAAVRVVVMFAAMLLALKFSAAIGVDWAIGAVVAFIVLTRWSTKRALPQHAAARMTRYVVRELRARRVL